MIRLLDDYFTAMVRIIFEHDGTVEQLVGDEIVAFPEIDYDDYPDGFPHAPTIQIVAASDADARDRAQHVP